MFLEKMEILQRRRITVTTAHCVSLVDLSAKNAGRRMLFFRFNQNLR